MIKCNIDASAALELVQRQLPAAVPYVKATFLTNAAQGVQGAADPNFACAVRAFAAMFPHRRFGGGALSVYLDGEPVVDVWTGWSDRAGRQHWDADTGAMVFSATKGVASTVIHRLADRGLIDYDAPVAEYWHEFGANGKADITVREMMSHRAGLSGLPIKAGDDVRDHLQMEERLAAAVRRPLGFLPADLLGEEDLGHAAFGQLADEVVLSVPLNGHGARRRARVFGAHREPPRPSQRTMMVSAPSSTTRAWPPRSAFHGSMRTSACGRMRHALGFRQFGNEWF